MTQASGSRSGGTERSRSGIRVPARLGVELGIIFAGVFGAFIAEDVRQQREDDRRATQIYEALLGEVRLFSERAPYVTEQMQSVADSWSAAYAEGKRPPPPHYREPDAETPPTAIWEATLASGGVALLEPELFTRLAEFYNRLGSVSDRYLRYNEFTERELLPRLSGDPSQFYGTDGQLLGTYRTHVDRLAEIREDIRARTEESVEIEALIRAELER